MPRPTGWMSMHGPWRHGDKQWSRHRDAVIIDWATEQFPIRKEHTQPEDRNCLVHTTVRMHLVLDGPIKKIGSANA